LQQRILVTGSSGVIGRCLVAALRASGYAVPCLDSRAIGADCGDVRDRGRMRQALDDVDGIVHLAAVSRVADAEEDPDLCWATNVTALADMMTLVAERRTPPWLLFTSSREVYGQPQAFPVSEDCELAPINTYGRSKLAGERLVQAAACKGVRSSIVRLGNVYGSPFDHPTRVVPAFVGAAIQGLDLQVHGPHRVFDFVHVDDVVGGLCKAIELLVHGATLPPLQLVSGRPTSLAELARLARLTTRSNVGIYERQPQGFEVRGFVGSHALAGAVLGWRPKVSLDQGLSRLAQAIVNELPRDHFDEIST